MENRLYAYSQNDYHSFTLRDGTVFAIIFGIDVYSTDTNVMLTCTFSNGDIIDSGITRDTYNTGPLYFYCASTYLFQFSELDSTAHLINPVANEYQPGSVFSDTQELVDEIGQMVYEDVFNNRTTHHVPTTKTVYNSISNLIIPSVWICSADTYDSVKELSVVSGTFKYREGEVLYIYFENGILFDDDILIRTYDNAGVGYDIPLFVHDESSSIFYNENQFCLDGMFVMAVVYMNACFYMVNGGVLTYIIDQLNSILNNI